MKANGESIKAIAIRLKLSRNTVRQYLRSSKPPEFKKQKYEKLLDSYTEEVKKMLEK